MSDADARPLVQCSKYVHVPAVVDTADSGGVAKFSDWAQFNILSTCRRRISNPRPAACLAVPFLSPLVGV